MRDTPRTEVYVLDQLPQVVSADWARQLERELNAAKARVAELEARCKRLEEAGDQMADWNMNERNLGCDPELADAWQQAKEAKPCPHCLRVECECSEFDACHDMGDK